MAIDVSQGSGKTVACDVVGTPSNPISTQQVQFVALATGTLGALALATATNPTFTQLTDATNTIKSGSAANLSATSSVNAQLAVRPGDWSINHTPAAATQATITKAAGAAGVRHVCTSISATLATIGTAQSSAIVLSLRDGTTGAGTILWSKQAVLPANALWEVNISNLNIVGTAATGMTLEFGAAGATASFSSVALTGYDTV